MAPHLEYYGAEVRNTMHVTGDTESYNARKAHALLREHPEEYNEVADVKGDVCVTEKEHGDVVVLTENR